MKFRMICTVLSTFLLAAVMASAQTTTNINFDTTYQTIRGFGISTAWQPLLDSTQTHNLFGVGTGQVGFTIARQFLFAVGTPSAGSRASPAPQQIFTKLPNDSLGAG